MGSKWKKLLGFKSSCLYQPLTSDDASPSGELSGRISGGVSNSPSVHFNDTTTGSSSGLLRMSKSYSKSSKKTCAICLNSMKPGQGHAIFTAECSHAFHFHCITSNVKHGNQICPVCRAKWKEIPFQSPASELLNGKGRIGPINFAQSDDWTTVVRRLPSSRLNAHRNISSFPQVSEPNVFDDDEILPDINSPTSTEHPSDSHSVGSIEVKTYPEVSAVSRSTCHDNFNVLVYLKAPRTIAKSDCTINSSDLPSASQSGRAPVDLVTVLDVSGSMAGTKLALLKRAMGFVIANLGPSDRLSVVTFSSAARRLFPLSCMTDTGKQLALQAVNSLISNGGTNIAEGLRKAAKVMTERKLKNSVESIILLSDGQDTYTTSNQGGVRRTDYQSLLPSSIHNNGDTSFQIPVHAFGFGTDHDAVSMHSISEASGGTFSFIEAEGVIQDAFAQCIGGLLSVVVQELRVGIECVHPSLKLSSVKAGSYRTSMLDGARTAFIDVGDLYAEEERNFMVRLNIPDDRSLADMSLLKVRYTYRNPINKEMVSMEEASELKIQRPERIDQSIVSMEVDRQRNRLCAAEAMAEARASAENGDLSRAVSVLEACCSVLSESIAAQAGDKMCVALGAELKEMQERMANRQIYESSGRAYVLSGISSHSFQRATARGDSTESATLLQAYQTPSMVNMLTRSQTMILGSPPSRQPFRAARSFQYRTQPS